MKKVFALIALSILTTACERKHGDTHPGALPGVASAPQTVTKYGGTINPAPVPGQQTYRQVVNVNADVITYDSDRVEVYLCKNQDCSTGNIPTLQCSQNPGVNDACYSTIPYVQIYLGHGTVGFINAADVSYADAAQTIVLQKGYSTYFIKTTISR